LLIRFSPADRSRLPFQNAWREVDGKGVGEAISMEGMAAERDGEDEDEDEEEL